MATRYITRSLLTTTKQSLFSSFPRSFTYASLPTTPSTFFLRLRPLVSVAANFRQAFSSGTTVRCFSTRRTSSSLNDPNPNWSNRPPKETILLDGCDFEHWLVVVEKPEGDPTRDEIIDSYIKTLATVVGSEEEARMKIYSVSTRHYFAFGALVSEELSYKLKELEKVRWVLPDSYLDVKNKDYGGEPFINGQAVPYDPKYHEEWVRNNARANERNRRNDRPRNFDRSRNFERRPNGGPSGGPNMGGAPGPNMPPNMSGPPNMANVQPNSGGSPPRYISGPPNMPTNNFSRPPNMAGPPPPTNMQGHQNNMAGPPPPTNMQGYQNNMAGPPPPTNMQGHQNNMAGPPPPTNMQGHQNNPYQNQNNYAPNQSGGYPYQNQNNYAPNQSGGYPYQNQNLPGRDM